MMGLGFLASARPHSKGMRVASPPSRLTAHPMLPACGAFRESLIHAEIYRILQIKDVIKIGEKSPHVNH